MEGWLSSSSSSPLMYPGTTCNETGSPPPSRSLEHHVGPVPSGLPVHVVVLPVLSPVAAAPVPPVVDLAAAAVVVVVRPVEEVSRVSVLLPMLLLVMVVVVLMSLGRFPGDCSCCVPPSPEPDRGAALAAADKVAAADPPAAVHDEEEADDAEIEMCVCGFRRNLCRSVQFLSSLSLLFPPQAGNGFLCTELTKILPRRTREPPDDVFIIADAVCVFRRRNSRGCNDNILPSQNCLKLRDF